VAERISYKRSVAVLTAFAGESDPTRFDSLDAFRTGYCAVYAAALLRAHEGWSVMSVGTGGCQVPDPAWHWGDKDVEGIAAWAVELASS